MNGISKKTCEEIWHCHREIETGRELLDEIGKIDEQRKQHYAHDAPALKDVFGNRRDLTLGVPSGSSGHRLFNVPWPLAKYVIEAHIAAKIKELAEYQIKARMELDKSDA